MTDLRNERDAVCRRLVDFNMEPVNAEAVLPTGQDSWGRLRDEIGSSDVFVLVLGDRYGWIPDAGPFGTAGMSVTELEYRAALRAEIPVLVFMKVLPYSTTAPTQDEARRNAFRAQVAAWGEGVFRAEFELAHDLADKVGAAVVGLLSNRFKAEQVARRRLQRDVSEVPVPTSEPLRPVLPAALVDAVVQRDAVLFIGSGVSLEAGLPGVAAFVEAMISRIREVRPDYTPTVSGSLFNAVATDVSLVLGRDGLAAVARQLVDPPFVESTSAHRRAVEIFDLILTTNYDTLLEQAAAHSQFVTRPVLRGDLEGEAAALPSRAIVKLHGSVEDAGSLVLTEADLAGLEVDRAAMLGAVQNRLRTMPLIAVGTSFRDPSLVRLLDSCRPQVHGWSVAPDSSPLDESRLDRWRLTPIRTDATSFFASLAAAIEGQGPAG